MSRPGNKLNRWGDPILVNGVPNWPKEEIQDMICELLGCNLKHAKHVYGNWVLSKVSPRVKLLELAAEQDPD